MRVSSVADASELVPLHFSWDGGDASVRVRVSRRARRWRVVVHGPAEIEVVVPTRLGEATVEQMLETTRPWLTRTLSRETTRPQLGLAGRTWLDGRPVPDTLDELAYRRAARHALRDAISATAPRLDVEPGGLRVGDPRSRWGSCSSRGTLAFSWRLIVPPRRVLDYVVVHELCHLLHPHHRVEFWNAVAELRPSWRDDADWLARHGRELQSYIPPAEALRQARRS